MSLPEPPPGESRGLLQTIWNLAVKTGNWPTFAELDRRWDSQYDTDVLDILRQLPEGFANGIDLRIQPQPTSRIGLTVAGAAACEGAQETLSIFLDFVRVATGAEKGWLPPPDNPEAQPTLTDQEYARQARGLPAAGRQHLLRLLFLLIHSEPSVWTGTGGPDSDGHWRITLNRRIRPFRKVTDLDVYWTLRYKSWEPPSEPPTAAKPQEPASDVQRALLSAHPQVLSATLLDWIHTAAAGSLTAMMACEAFRPDINRAVIEEALRRLESRGHIQLHWLNPTPALPDVMLTSSGAAQAESARERWSSKTLRDRATRNALLAWLHDNEAAQHGPVRIADFLRDPRSAIDGHFLSAGDLDAAATYLNQKGLIDGHFIEEQHYPYAARLTADGTDCMEQGGNVAEYLAPRPGGVTYNFHAPVSGTNVAVGDNATQHATISGIDTDSLRVLMKAITEALPGLGLDTHDQKDAQNATNQVVSEIEQQQPDQQRLGAILRKVRDLLTKAGNQALAAVLSASIDYERSKLGLPPAS
jgi:hypothetical protein